ncbi:cupin domain-containing protein [Cyclobacterium jeungdonense]|uniref:Cupin domain-containing protein n=1 Tax=Cyclobacterium jeungdonense TaxID=708087 RepID=A0ABT8CC79_9BACT|nr:cupin domain-containing protein [Cyclobacterium jeungdonense]MDN3690125.1 cupin domain-containing protein [Cyclobacterium jeungdonense]
MDNFPGDKLLNYIEGWGEMTVAVNEMPAGTDLALLLEGLKNDSCQVPHWGYILKGVLRLTYDDGTEVVLKEGDVFYMPPGHVAVVEEDLKLMNFSPQEGFSDLMKHLEAIMAESVE